MPGVANKPKVYGLYVQGDSMAPWAESGDLIFADPNQPPRINDYVVIQLKSRDGGPLIRAYVKRLVGRTPTSIRVAQYQPAKTIEFDLADVERLHRVLTNKDLTA